MIDFSKYDTQRRRFAPPPMKPMEADLKVKFARIVLLPGGTGT